MYTEIPLKKRCNSDAVGFKYKYTLINIENRMVLAIKNNK